MVTIETPLTRLRGLRHGPGLSVPDYQGVIETPLTRLRGLRLYSEHNSSFPRGDRNTTDPFEGIETIIRIVVWTVDFYRNTTDPFEGIETRRQRQRSVFSNPHRNTTDPFEGIETFFR